METEPTDFKKLNNCFPTIVLKKIYNLIPVRGNWLCFLRQVDKNMHCPGLGI